MTGFMLMNPKQNTEPPLHLSSKAASGALSEFCEEYRWLLLTVSLPWTSTWTRAARGLQDGAAAGHTAHGAPHVPQSRWVFLSSSSLLMTWPCRVSMVLCCVRAGPGPPDQKEASPFVIEWTPDVLPRCQMGELRISFEFGHQQSGQPELSEKGTLTERGARVKAESAQPKLPKAIQVLQMVV